MTSRLPRVSGKDVLNALLRNKFSLIDIEGSHHTLESPTGELVTVPVHGKKILKLRTLKTILKQADLTADELRNLL